MDHTGTLHDILIGALKERNESERLAKTGQDVDLHATLQLARHVMFRHNAGFFSVVTA